jgi:hypothetical protein
MFNQITLLDYKRPMRERLESRKYCGPYQWHPTQPGKGRCFYQASKGLWMDERGSSFALRIEEANDHLPGRRHPSGYYADNFQDTTLTPIVARLPHGRGFLAGWTMGRGMVACVDADIYADIRDAALAAHSMAEHAAECEREHQEKAFLAGQEEDED